MRNKMSQCVPQPTIGTAAKDEHWQGRGGMVKQIRRLLQSSEQHKGIVRKKHYDSTCWRQSGQRRNVQRLCVQLRQLLAVWRHYPGESFGSIEAGR